MTTPVRYRVSHVTHYRYNAPVSQCLSEARLTPRTLPWQTVESSVITTVPAPASITTRRDYFGNIVSAFSIVESHERYSTQATSLVEVRPRPALSPGVPWEAAREALTAHVSSDTLAALEYTCESPFVPIADELAAYARTSFTPGRVLTEAARELSHRVFTEFAYKPSSTAIDTPLLDTLRLRRGVCQDFSHVMIGALRGLGLAARYVSGYLRSGADYQGAEASHAWVSVYCPGDGWVDFDPTNDVLPDTGHVTVAWGRDYGDVAPVKGIALGGGKQVVDVAVRVDPEPSNQPSQSRQPNQSSQSGQSGQTNPAGRPGPL